MSISEFTGRYMDGWVSRRFVMPLRRIKKESPLTIYGRRHYMYPENLTLFIKVNGEIVHEACIPTEQFAITVQIPQMIRGKLEIEASDVFVPKEKGMNEDVRELAFLLDDVVVSGLPDLMESYHEIFDFTPKKKVYFMEDELWDDLSFLLDKSYKVPDKEMLQPLKDPDWWRRLIPVPSSFLRGVVYDKFSGVPLPKAEVQIFHKSKQFLMETACNDLGYYEVNGLAAGDYVVSGKSQQYGDQQIGVKISGYGNLINIPMLPLP